MPEHRIDRNKLGKKRPVPVNYSRIKRFGTVMALRFGYKFSASPITHKGDPALQALFLDGLDSVSKVFIFKGDQVFVDGQEIKTVQVLTAVYEQMLSGVTIEI